MTSLNEWAQAHIARLEDPTKAAEALLVTVRNVAPIRNEFLDRFGLANCVDVVSEVMLNTAPADICSAANTPEAQQDAVTSNAPTSNTEGATNRESASTSDESPLASEQRNAQPANINGSAVPSATPTQATSASKITAPPGSLSPVNIVGTPTAVKPVLTQDYKGHKTPKGTMPKFIGRTSTTKQVIDLVEKHLNEEIFTGRKLRECTRQDLEDAARRSDRMSIYYSRLAKQMPMDAKMTVEECFNEQDLARVWKGAAIGEGVIRNAKTNGDSEARVN